MTKALVAGAASALVLIALTTPAHAQANTIEFDPSVAQPGQQISFAAECPNATAGADFISPPDGVLQGVSINIDDLPTVAGAGTLAPGTANGAYHYVVVCTDAQDAPIGEVRGTLTVQAVTPTTTPPLTTPTQPPTTTTPATAGSQVGEKPIGGVAAGGGGTAP